jgi:IS5 family transposase
VVASATAAVETTATMRGTDLLAAMRIAALRDEIAHYCGLGARVIDQARRRVLDGEQVPTAEKIYSIFEPDTDLIKRGKVKTPVEFGHKVFLAESAKGLITQYEILDATRKDSRKADDATLICVRTPQKSLNLHLITDFSILKSYHVALVKNN